jgi:hypothetical protein
MAHLSSQSGALRCRAIAFRNATPYFSGGIPWFMDVHAKYNELVFICIHGVFVNQRSHHVWEQQFVERRNGDFNGHFMELT